MPGTGSSRACISGDRRPTVPGLLAIGVFIASTGAVSVTP